MADVTQEINEIKKMNNKEYNNSQKFVKKINKVEKMKNDKNTLKFVNNEDKEGHFIQIKKENVIKIGIKDETGNPTGQYLEFDMDDIELPLKLSQCEYLHNKNMRELNNKLVIIKKRQDVKGKFLISKNEEESIKAFREYYKKEEEALDLFLGNGGTKKLLNGRHPYYNMYDDFGEMLEPILPLFKNTADNINALVKEKYSNNIEGDTIE